MNTPTKPTPGQVLSDADAKELQDLADNYTSLMEQWEEAREGSQETANLYLTFRGQERRLAKLAEGGFFARLASVLSHSAPAGAAPAVGAGEAVARVQKMAREYAIHYADYRAQSGFEGREENTQKLLALEEAIASLAAPQVAADERAAFEVWAEANDFCIHRDETPKYANYHRATTRFAWEAWQARSASPSPAPAAPAERKQSGEIARGAQASWNCGTCGIPSCAGECLGSCGTTAPTGDAS